MIWAGLGVLIALVMAALLWPLFRVPRSAGARSAYDILIFEDQLKDLERDLERGVLTATEADAARTEIQRRILSASKASGPMPTTGSKTWRLGLSGGLAISVPLLAFAAYLPLGEPTLPGSSAEQRAEAATAAAVESNRLLEELAAHVAANPDDVAGLSLLANSYRQVRRFEDAANAYLQLAQIAPSADTFVNLGETLAAAYGGISGDAHDAFMKALELDPSEPRSRFYLGIEQAQQGNAELAIAIWRDLAADAPEDATWLNLVMEEMSRTAQQAGIAPMSVSPAHPLDLPLTRPQGVASRQAGPISPDDMEMIQGMVAGLAARLESNPDDYDGWMMLGRSYTVLDQFDDAIEAYERAIVLRPDDISSKLQFASLMIAKTDLDAPGSLPAALEQTMADILEINPSHPDALFITGLAKAKSGNTNEARILWERALNAAPSPPLRAEVQRRLNNLN